MSLTTLGLVNAILVLTVVGALAYVCRLPFKLDRGDSTSAAVPVNELDPEGVEIATGPATP
jgi:hypothetical protein